MPSVPRDINAIFVNEAAVEITWWPPAITRETTDVFYDVICRKHGNIGKANCLEKACGSGVSYMSTAVRIHGTRVTVTNLSPYVTYTFNVYARNRLSKVAKD